MLPIPTTITGLGYEDADETIVYADWIECSVLLYDEDISKADIIDCFSEIDSFDNENTQIKVEDIISELERRKCVFGSKYPISIKGNRITTTANWRDYAAYSFCLLLSYSKSNQELEKKLFQDYQIQGALFEHISIASIMHLLKNWNVIHTGWSKGKSVSIKKQIEGIAKELGEQIIEYPRTADKDGGVDILCYRPFPDKRGNYPVFFVQCASGKNWTDKRGLDVLNLWKSWIHFRAKDILTRCFAVPFAFGDETFRQTQMRGNCVILDRIRLFSHGIVEREWLPKDLFAKIETWVSKKINALSKD